MDSLLEFYNFMRDDVCPDSQQAPLGKSYKMHLKKANPESYVGMHFLADIIALTNERDLETRNAADQAAQNDTDSSMIFGGIVFNNFDYVEGKIPPLDYKIRFDRSAMESERGERVDTNFLFPPFQVPGPATYYKGIIL